jgi:hypothetical protein
MSLPNRGRVGGVSVVEKRAEQHVPRSVDGEQRNPSVPHEEEDVAVVDRRTVRPRRLRRPDPSPGRRSRLYGLPVVRVFVPVPPSILVHQLAFSEPMEPGGLRPLPSSRRNMPACRQKGALPWQS